MSTTTPSATSSDPEEDILEDSEELDPVRDRGVGEYGCRHYRRRAKLVTPCWCEAVRRGPGFLNWQYRHVLSGEKKGSVWPMLTPGCIYAQRLGVLVPPLSQRGPAGQ